MLNKTKIVLVGGVFDILHYGHITFLKRAKKLGTYLIVAIEADARVRKLKGPKRPFHPQIQRKEILESLKFVDKVIILKDEMSDKDYKDLVYNVRPQIIAVTKGDLFIEKKKMQAKQVGSKVVEIPLIKTYSTTQLAKIMELE